MKRRSFLKNSSFGLGAIVLPWLPSPTQTAEDAISFAIVADAHQDIMHDAEKRLAFFMEKALAQNLDFHLQLGDFCEPKLKNKNFLQLWNNYKGPKHNVLGNHDMDSGTKEASMDFWQMPGKYYSFDQKGFHFIILDANYLNLEGSFVDYSKANFYIDNRHRTWINPQQIEWLEEDLAKTNLPTVIFSHQGLATDAWGIKNRTQIQKIFESTNKKAGFQKVIACFNGHNHVDAYRQLNGIYYIDINSLSYQWLGEKYQCFTRYPKATYEKHPVLSKLAPYKDPLYAIVHLEAKGQLSIEGTSSSWLGPSPEDLGFPKGFYGYDYSPQISDQVFNFK